VLDRREVGPMVDTQSALRDASLKRGRMVDLRSEQQISMGIELHNAYGSIARQGSRRTLALATPSRPPLPRLSEKLLVAR